MQHKTIPLILHPNFTKVAALILAYTIWLFGSNYQWVTREYQIPLCFHTAQEKNITAPESATVTIAGPRNQMHYLHAADLAIHIDVSNFKDGDHEIILNPSNLFLPETLKMVELIPAIVSCNIQTI